MAVDGRAVAGQSDRDAVGRARTQSVVPLGKLRFLNAAASVAMVRRFVGLVAEAYSVAQIGETAALLVSELATNATRHAAGGGRIEVVVSRRADRLRVEVRDGSSALPVMRCSGVLDEGGRGLLLVDQLADGHGTYRLPLGKAVWFELIAWDPSIGGLDCMELDHG